MQRTPLHEVVMVWRDRSHIGGGNVVGVGARVIGCADNDVGPPLANVLRHGNIRLVCLHPFENGAGW